MRHALPGCEFIARLLGGSASIDVNRPSHLTSLAVDTP